MPAKARIGAFGCQERYGLIWVALAEPRWPLPEVPELEDGGWTVVTADSSRSAHFEHTVAVGDDGPEVLTVAW